jgi:5'-nucleotidase
MDGMNILFIGIVTQEVMSSIRLDSLLGSLIDVEDAAREVGRICNAYRSVDIDFTILLTHIGFEEDKRLAALLDPDWGVDVIIGGHSHTILEQPALVGDVLIAQAGVGTKQIGRFDIMVDTDLNSVYSFEWQLIPIDSRHCPRDTQLEDTIARFQQHVDEKYNCVLCRFPRALTHPSRYQETELGNLFSDAVCESLGADLVLFGSGAIRKEQAGPVFTRGDMLELTPFDDRLFLLKATGAQLRQMLSHVLRDENLDGAHGEFYQFSEGLCVTYDRAARAFTRFEFEGAPLEDGRVLSIGLQEFHYKNFDEFFGLSRALLVDGKGIVAATCLLDVLEEYLSSHHQREGEVEGRLVVE